MAGWLGAWRRATPACPGAAAAPAGLHAALTDAPPLQHDRLKTNPLDIIAQRVREGPLLLLKRCYQVRCCLCGSSGMGSRHSAAEHQPPGRPKVRVACSLGCGGCWRNPLFPPTGAGPRASRDAARSRRARHLGRCATCRGAPAAPPAQMLVPSACDAPARLQLRLPAAGPLAQANVWCLPAARCCSFGRVRDPHP